MTKPQWARWWWLGVLCLAFELHAQEWRNGVVVSVHDGDTATVETTQGRILRVRFYGVDAPERENEYWPDQAFARDAGAFMQKLLRDKAVAVRLTGDKTYGREVGEIFVDGRSATREILRAGLAWWNTKYAPHDSDLARLEQNARKAKRGLWRDAESMPPWEFRNRYRRRKH